MKLHGPSFLLGAGITVVLGVTRQRLRPVAVEVAALGLHLATLVLALAERYREDAEDLWAEVEERARVKRRVDGAGVADGVPAPSSASVGA